MKIPMKKTTITFDTARYLDLNARKRKLFLSFNQISQRNKIGFFLFPNRASNMAHSRLIYTLWARKAKKENE